MAFPLPFWLLWMKCQNRSRVMFKSQMTGTNAVRWGLVMHELWHNLVSTEGECRKRLKLYWSKLDWSYRNVRSMFLSHRAMRNCPLWRNTVGMGRWLDSEILWGYAVTALSRGPSYFTSVKLNWGVPVEPVFSVSQCFKKALKLLLRCSKLAVLRH